MEAFNELNSMMKMAHDDGMMMSSIINWKCCDLTILFEWWHVDSCTGFFFTLVGLFVLTIAGEMMGAYKHPLATKLAIRPWLLEPLLLLFAWKRTLIGALMMLTMMSFNGYIILTITLASAVSKTVCMKNLTMDNQHESVLCH